LLIKIMIIVVNKNVFKIHNVIKDIKELYLFLLLIYYNN